MFNLIKTCHVIFSRHFHLFRLIFVRQCLSSLLFRSQLKFSGIHLPKIMNSSYPTKNRGQLIVFEGLDRSGKTTQSRKLKEALEKDGKPVTLWTFPDRSTALGDMINKYLNKTIELDDRAIHLIFSANRWEKCQSLIKLLNSGNTVIIDRYAFSGVAYSASKKLPLEWCKQPDVGLPQPDCVVFLQLSPEEGAKRIGFGEERYEKIQFQKTVQEQFMKIKDQNWKVLDATKTVEELHQEIYQHIKSIQQKDLKYLWTK